MIASPASGLGDQASGCALCCSTTTSPIDRRAMALQMLGRFDRGSMPPPSTSSIRRPDGALHRSRSCRWRRGRSTIRGRPGLWGLLARFRADADEAPAASSASKRLLIPAVKLHAHALSTPGDGAGASTNPWGPPPPALGHCLRRGRDPIPRLVIPQSNVVAFPQLPLCPAARCSPPRRRAMPSRRAGSRMSQRRRSVPAEPRMERRRRRGHRAGGGPPPVVLMLEQLATAGLLPKKVLVSGVETNGLQLHQRGDERPELPARATSVRRPTVVEAFPSLRRSLPRALPRCPRAGSKLADLTVFGNRMVSWLAPSGAAAASRAYQGSSTGGVDLPHVRPAPRVTADTHYITVVHHLRGDDQTSSPSGEEPTNALSARTPRFEPRQSDPSAALESCTSRRRLRSGRGRIGSPGQPCCTERLVDASRARPFAITDESLRVRASKQCWALLRVTTRRDAAGNLTEQAPGPKSSDGRHSGPPMGSSGPAAVARRRCWRRWRPPSARAIRAVARAARPHPADGLVRSARRPGYQAGRSLLRPRYPLPACPQRPVAHGGMGSST